MIVQVSVLARGISTMRSRQLHTVTVVSQWLPPKFHAAENLWMALMIKSATLACAIRSPGM
ncbi:hypothetical protein EI94DRAFT_1727922 [Lactarius quietus]|nr:hypothetical protein EI94DRAFT_1727922 [Lactarius quietus]